MSEEATFVLHLRPARIRAKAAAAAEAVSLLRDLGASAPGGGPLSERKGVVWIALPVDQVVRAVPRLIRLGYTRAVDLVEAVSSTAGPPLPPTPSPKTKGRGSTPHGPTPPRPSPQAEREQICPRDGWGSSLRLRGDRGGLPAPCNLSGGESGPSGEEIVRWQKQSWRVIRIYEEDPDAGREQAPDRRPFLFEAADGSVREVRGYRGDGGPLSRRGLPVCDARLLVNLAAPIGDGSLFLDPFAGAGGVVLEACGQGWRTVAVDFDPRLRHGLARISDLNCVADARRLPFRDGSIDAVAAEPPYDPDADPMVLEAFGEMTRTVRPGGRIALLVSVPQSERLRGRAAELGLSAILDSPIDRKGLEVVALAWERPAIP